MSAYKHLFTPLRIGSMEVPNRIMMAGHLALGLIQGSDEHVGYFEARAKGGAGLLGIASCLLHPNPADGMGLLFEIYDDRDVPKIKRVVDACHKHGSKVVVQGIWLTSYPGMQTPSSVPMRLEGISQARTMSKADIEQLTEWHARGAYHAKLAGADGVEFPLGGGDGLQHFMSKLYNKRIDEYGGDMEGRLREVLAICKAIKQRCGADFNIGFCVNADDSLLGGASLAEGVEGCKMLADSGLVDWLRVVGNSQKPQHYQLWYPPSLFPQGTHLYAAAAVREEVTNIPIISGGRINSPEFADQAIDEGQCDMVFSARAFICDPEWPKKAREGRSDEIRGCIGDVEGCFGGIHERGAMGCTCNPDIGREHLELEIAARTKNIVVVGAGPAGLQCAYTAARRGHKVTVIEKREEVGGHVRMESRFPGFSDRGEFPRWLEARAKDAGAKVFTGTEATAESVISMKPDAVVVATGAEYARDGITWRNTMGIEGLDQSRVFTPEDVVLDGRRPTGRVAVYDGTGHIAGPGIAALLADAGNDVVYLTTEAFMAKDLECVGIHQLLEMRIYPKVEYHANAVVKSMSESNIHVLDVMTYREYDIDGIGSIVLVGSKPPLDDLYRELAGRVPELHIVGDADVSKWSIFGINDAVKAGDALGRQL